MASTVQASSDYAGAAPILDVANLRISLPTARGMLHAVRGIDLRILKGQTLGLVGESGCGKSLTALSILKILPRDAQLSADTMAFREHDLLGLPPNRMNALRGERISMIFQEPMTALNPTFTIGSQLGDVFRHHRRATRRAAEERAVYLLERVGIRDPGLRLSQYPHQLSGGLRQRVLIAMALMCEPELIIADEPTTALDVTVQLQILELLKDLQAEFGLAMLLITHDLGVVARFADHVSVMYAGQILESGRATDILSRPRHPYTEGLLDCIPQPSDRLSGRSLPVIPGMVPSLLEVVPACAFAPRCPYAAEVCTHSVPALEPYGEGLYRRCFAPFETK